jgi:putative acetyltransferase
MAGGALLVRRIPPADPAALGLLRASDEYLSSLYPPESTHLESAAALAAPHVAFFGAFIDGELHGCGALKRMQDDGVYGEVKRVFVAPQFRGRGIARALMAHIEAHASDTGVILLRLETGVSQPEALRLYEALGYQRRGPFGHYGPDPLSVFMEKRLATHAYGEDRQ